MSVQTGRMVSADEAHIITPLQARHALDAGALGDYERNLAHTVLVQAEQIAAALALHTRVEGGSVTDDYCAHCVRDGASPSGAMRLVFYPCPTARALGVSGE